MNKIPKCNNNKIIPLKINKKGNKESICGKIKMKILSNKAVIRSFGQDITNFSKIKNKIIGAKKSSSYNGKVSQYYNNIQNYYITYRITIILI